MDGKNNSHAGTIPFRAFDLNFSAVGAHKFVANGKAEPGSGRLGGEEGVKNSADHAGADPVSRVAKFNPDLLGSGCGLHRGGHAHPQSPSRFGHGFKGILNDVVENLGHLALVDWKQSPILRKTGYEIDAVLLSVL